VGSVFRFMKTTILGGVVFLVPLVFLVWILGKALSLTMVVAEPLDEQIPDESVAGIAVINLVAVAIVTLTCFLAGLLARSTVGKGIFHSLDDSLLGLIPGYAVAKGRVTGNLAGHDSMKPVMARFDDYAQIAFEIDRTESGLVTLFLPGAPDPWSGTVVFASPDRVQPLATDFSTALRTFKSLGRTAAEVVDGRSPPAAKSDYST
jgi:uncharacterized membrane protein